MRLRVRLLPAIAALALAHPLGLRAEESPTIRLGLSEAVERALASSARLRSLEQGRESAEAQLRLARAALHTRLARPEK